MIHPALLLLRLGKDFTGGEFGLGEQRLRMQSRHGFAPLAQGRAMCMQFTTGRCRPARVCRGNMRRGVSRLFFRHRHTVDVIFHDTQ